MNIHWFYMKRIYAYISLNSPALKSLKLSGYGVKNLWLLQLYDIF